MLICNVSKFSKCVYYRADHLSLANMTWLIFISKRYRKTTRLNQSILLHQPDQRYISY